MRRFDVQFQIPYAAKTKIIASLGPKSREIEVIEKLLKAGMSGESMVFMLYVPHEEKPKDLYYEHRI